MLHLLLMIRRWACAQEPSLEGNVNEREWNVMAASRSPEVMNISMECTIMVSKYGFKRFSRYQKATYRGTGRGRSSRVSIILFGGN